MNSGRSILDKPAIPRTADSYDYSELKKVCQLFKHYKDFEALLNSAMDDLRYDKNISEKSSI